VSRQRAVIHVHVSAFLAGMQVGLVPREVVWKEKLHIRVNANRLG